MVSCEITPLTLNLQSQGLKLSIKTTLMNPATGGILDPTFLNPVYISRVRSPSVGEVVLPKPRAEPGCDDFTEDGIWETFGDREINAFGTANLRFKTPFDGKCETMDGNRQDIIALMLDIPDGETAQICYESSHPSSPDPVECCSIVTVANRGNR